jgi:hypothetical protein
MCLYWCVLRPNSHPPSHCPLPPCLCVPMFTRAVMCAPCVVVPWSVSMRRAIVCVRVCGFPALPPPRIKSLWSPHTPSFILCVCTPLAWCAPLPPLSQVPCVQRVWFHLVCLSCTYVLHTPHGHPHVQPTPPYGCHRAIWILCDDARMGMQWGVLWWLRSSTRCTSSSSSTHIHGSDWNGGFECGEQQNNCVNNGTECATERTLCALVCGWWAVGGGWWGRCFQSVFMHGIC